MSEDEFGYYIWSHGYKVAFSSVPPEISATTFDVKGASGDVYSLINAHFEVIGTLQIAQNTINVLCEDPARDTTAYFYEVGDEAQLLGDEIMIRLLKRPIDDGYSLIDD